MSADYSKDALLKFFEYVASKGLVNANTASARKAAANRMLSVIDATEAADLRGIDLDLVSTKFFNLHGKDFTPDSMNVYKSRLRSGITDFIKYTENPSAFKPDAPRQRISNRKDIEVRVSSNTNNNNSSVSSEPLSSHTINSSDSVFPIPIRSDLTVKLIGLPSDLSRKEANKIANIVLAFALTDDE